MNRSILKKYDENAEENQLPLYGRNALSITTSNTQHVLEEASAYLDLFYKERGSADIPFEHLAEVHKEVEQTGTYHAKL